VIDRVEANPKLSHFEGIFSLYTILKTLDTFPVFIREHGVVVGDQRRSLKVCQLGMDKPVSWMISIVNIEVDCLRSCIISILYQLL